MRIKMLAQIPYEVFYSPNYPGSTLDRIMPKEKCAIWDENGNDILAVRYIRDDPETFMKSVVGTDTDNLEELAEVIESQYDHEVDIELKSVTAAMAELDEFAMKESVPCLEFRGPLNAGDFIPSTLVTDKLYFVDIRDKKDIATVNAVLDDWDSNGGRVTKDYIGKTVLVVLGYDDDGEKREFSDFYGTIDECVIEFKKDLENAATSDSNLS